MSKKDRLFEQFPQVSTAAWMEKIQADLKGADFNKKLVWRTREGLDIMPFYRAEDLESLHTDTLPGQYPYIRGTKVSNNSWLIRQDIKADNCEAANKKALEVLMRGADSLGFIISDPETINETNINILLKNIHPEAIELNFLTSGRAKELFDLIKDFAAKRNLKASDINGAIEADPLGRLMRNGTLCISPGEGFDYLAALTRQTLEFPNLKTVHISVSDFNNAGADIVTELAFGLAMGSEYMNQLTGRGLIGSDAASKLRFSFAAGSNYFFEIAKLRAARLLWSVIQKGFGIEDPHEMCIHCTTSRWNMTVYDPYVNMLRTQTEAMSAVLGGTRSLTVAPFDIAFKESDDFSERIARNQQLILKEEAHFDKVADPAAGSYYIEKLTGDLADNAWKLFLEVEAMGGFLEGLKSGYIQKKIAASAATAKKDVASRKTVLLGTNQYPMIGETLQPAADTERMFSKKASPEDMLVEPLLLFRGSEEYEKLRLSVEKSGKNPVVFLLTIGNPVMRKARAQFSAVFFGCAGYSVIDNIGFATIE
ncbi:MAG TPA: acyl-CoA mutase large subunit family protein, partial [Bacteroidales bacterium]|nr:acyl-CoA mutase large subunit family protein [Bacteroidales bacterium]